MSSEQSAHNGDNLPIRTGLVEAFRGRVTSSLRLTTRSQSSIALLD
jgi:hypothetical protein